MSRVDLKVVMLGKEYCGKTSLVERYLYDRFDGDRPYQNTIGAAFGAKKIHVDSSRTFIMGIWDTAGAERYESMSRLYYRGAGAAIVCYDVMDVSSFDRTRFWVNELLKTERECKIYLCGTKIDLIEGDRKNRRIDYHNVTDFADEIKAQVFETSSKTGEGVAELFAKVAEDYVNGLTPSRGTSESRPSGHFLEERPASSKRPCPCW